MSVATEAASPVPEPVSAPVRVDWAVVPQVNLLPPEIIEARNFSRLKKTLALAVLGVVVLATGVALWAYSQVAAAQDAYDTAQNEMVQLQHQQAKYADVPKVKAELDAARAMREGAMATHVAWYSFLGDLALTTPAEARLNSVSISMDGTSQPTASSVPLQPASLGTVTVSGQAGKYVDVAAWLESVTEVNGMDGPLLQSAADDPNPSDPAFPVTFSGTAVITPKALSHLYDRKAG